ncbi:MAG: hypothetical protein EXS31_17850 [Pedosphaera sp.]|nr:hypothetical protein [Pedosphaera sp.]
MRVNLGQQPPIAIASAFISGTGEFTMTIRGQTGWTYRIEVSDDLVNWTLLRELPSTGTVTEFKDAVSFVEFNRFYRAARKD